MGKITTEQQAPQQAVLDQNGAKAMQLKKIKTRENNLRNIYVMFSSTNDNDYYVT